MLIVCDNVRSKRLPIYTLRIITFIDWTVGHVVSDSKTCAVSPHRKPTTSKGCFKITVVYITTVVMVCFFISSLYMASLYTTSMPRRAWQDEHLEISLPPPSQSVPCPGVVASITYHD